MYGRWSVNFFRQGLAIWPHKHYFVGMKNQYLFALTAIVAPVFFFSCHSTTAGSTNYKTIPLTEYKYAPAAISSGTEINILGFSGGKDGKKKDVYYSQFIGIEKGTGDTVRILAAWIQIPAESGSVPTLTPASMFDGQKGIREAAFVIPDNNQLSSIKIANSLADAEGDTARINKAMADTAIQQNEYVILQDDVPLFRGKYKTAIGIMDFKQQPW